MLIKSEPNCRRSDWCHWEIDCVENTFLYSAYVSKLIMVLMLPVCILSIHSCQNLTQIDVYCTFIILFRNHGQTIVIMMPTDGIFPSLHIYYPVLISTFQSPHFCVNTHRSPAPWTGATPDSCDVIDVQYRTSGACKTTATKAHVFTNRFASNDTSCGQRIYSYQFRATVYAKVPNA